MVPFAVRPFRNIWKWGITIINPDTYFNNILFILTNDHLMAGLMIFTFVIFLVFYYLKRLQKYQFNDVLYKLLIASIITQILSFLIVSKPFDGKSAYLVVTYALTALSFVVSASMLIIYLKPSKLSVAAMLTCFLTFSIVLNYSRYKDEFSSWYMTKNECAELEQFLHMHSDYNVITNNAYSPNKNQALLFGLVYSGVHEEKLMQLYPKTYFYNVLQGKFSNWLTKVPHELIFVNEKALLVDTYLNDSGKADFEKKGYTVKLLFSNRIKAVYELNGSKK